MHALGVFDGSGGANAGRKVIGLLGQDSGYTQYWTAPINADAIAYSIVMIQNLGDATFPVDSCDWGNCGARNRADYHQAAPGSQYVLSYCPAGGEHGTRGYADWDAWVLSAVKTMLHNQRGVPKFTGYVESSLVVGNACVTVADTTPNPFAFIDVTGVPLSTVQTSNAITVSGINAPAPISIIGGTYERNGSGIWTSNAGTVANGDTVRVRHTSAATYSTAVNTTLTIGEVSDTFTSTTLNAPNAFTLAVTVRGSVFGMVTSSPAGIDCVPFEACTAGYASGTAVTLTAVLYPGASFKQWGGACSGTATTCTVTMTTNRTVTSTFSQIFTDDPLTAGSTPIKAVHFNELTTAINALQNVWTYRPRTPGSTPMKVHLDDLRTGLNRAYQAAGRSAPTYTDPTIVAGQTPIKAIHIRELRNAVRALE